MLQDARFYGRRAAEGFVRADMFASGLALLSFLLFIRHFRRISRTIGRFVGPMIAALCVGAGGGAAALIRSTLDLTGEAVSRIPNERFIDAGTVRQLTGAAELLDKGDDSLRVAGILIALAIVGTAMLSFLHRRRRAVRGDRST